MTKGNIPKVDNGDIDDLDSTPLPEATNSSTSTAAASLPESPTQAWGAAPNETQEGEASVTPPVTASTEAAAPDTESEELRKKDAAKVLPAISEAKKKELDEKFKEKKKEEGEEITKQRQNRSEIDFFSSDENVNVLSGLFSEAPEEAAPIITVDPPISAPDPQIPVTANGNQNSPALPSATLPLMGVATGSDPKGSVTVVQNPANAGAALSAAGSTFVDSSVAANASPKIEVASELVAQSAVSVASSVPASEPQQDPQTHTAVVAQNLAEAVVQNLQSVQQNLNQAKLVVVAAAKTGAPTPSAAASNTSIIAPSQVATPAIPEAMSAEDAKTAKEAIENQEAAFKGFKFNSGAKAAFETVQKSPDKVAEISKQNVDDTAFKVFAAIANAVNQSSAPNKDEILKDVFNKFSFLANTPDKNEDKSRLSSLVATRSAEAELRKPDSAIASNNDLNSAVSSALKTVWDEVIKNGKQVKDKEAAEQKKSQEAVAQFNANQPSAEQQKLEEAKKKTDKNKDDDTDYKKLAKLAFLAAGALTLSIIVPPPVGIAMAIGFYNIFKDKEPEKEKAESTGLTEDQKKAASYGHFAEGLSKSIYANHPLMQEEDKKNKPLDHSAAPTTEVGKEAAKVAGTVAGDTRQKVATLNANKAALSAANAAPAAAGVGAISASAEASATPVVSSEIVPDVAMASKAEPAKLDNEEALRKAAAAIFGKEEMFDALKAIELEEDANVNKNAPTAVSSGGLKKSAESSRS
jgi:hypothetical protein